LNELRILFEWCLSAFESSILITHRSKYVQFIMFYMCGLESQSLSTTNADYQLSQQHATLNRDLAARFIKITFDPYRSTTVRQSAACYLASFVSRAKFVEADTVSESVCALLRWADAYIAALQANSLSAADARAQCELHSLFYTITQSAFYIMCFRGTDVMDLYHSVTEMKQNGIENVPEHLRDLPLQDIDIGPKRWENICGHPLQPLLYCLEAVRVEFLQFALTFGLLDAEMVARLSGEFPVAVPTASVSANGPEPGADSIAGNGSNPLKSFFPFDPYLLKNSFPFIQPYYRYWGGHSDAERSSVVEVTVPPVGDDEDPMEEEMEEHEVSSSDDDDDEEDEEKSLPAAKGTAASSVAHDGDIVPPSVMQKRNRSQSIESAGSW
jgi:RNA polymerase I-specific transcription initiation factor RRN3